MRNIMKILLGTVLVVILLAGGVLAYVVLVLDPNDYKSHIQELAGKQGVKLEISGDLGWRLFPNLALRVGETRISSDDPAIPETRFDDAQLSLAWRPLLKGKIQVHAVTIDGADLTITDQQQGKTTAGAPVAAAKPAEKNTANGFAIAIDSFTVKNSRIKLAEQNIELSILNFESKDINLHGETFPVSLAVEYQDSKVKKPVAIKVNGEFGLNIDREELVLKSVEINIADLSLTTDTMVTQIRSKPVANGSVKLAATNPRQLLGDLNIDLPPLPDKEALNRLRFETDFSASAEQIKLRDLVFVLDQTTISGQLGLKLQPPKALAIVVKGNHIDLNRYLTTEDATEAGTAKSARQVQAAAPVFAPLAAPLTFLDGGSSTLDVTWDSLKTAGLNVTDIHLVGASAGSTINIKDFSAKTLGGAIVAKIKLGQLTGKNPSASFNAQLTDISLEEASRTFADNADIEGLLSAEVNGQSSGATTDQLFDRLSVQGTMTLVEPALKKINIEKSYCDLAALVEKIPRRETWPPGTRLNKTEGRFSMRGRSLLLDNLDTGVGNLTLAANGEIDFGAGTFNVLATTRLNGDRTSENGCVVESTKLRNRDIPLRCKDSFAKAGAGSCRPDGDIVKKLATDKILEKIGDKSRLNEETGKTVEGLLKGLFDR